MAILKCKMCGGDVSISDDKTFGTCEYCGNSMTFPRFSDEHRTALFNRGNHFRRQGEFDKAISVYEQILSENDTDAEAHWCCAISRFGIEYVEDPTTMEWMPTCHRASFDNFLDDIDYLAAIENSDGITRKQYQKDALKIAEVQRGILATSQHEDPFDVFICYKESDENGNRTKDSTYAQEIYYQLTDAGYKVFFAKITLEDKAGSEYEPYIFAALNSAKVMVVVGTSKEHLDAVWVRNEWSRFLSMMKKDRSKILLPCYKDMDPYDLPDALSILQAYDMSKIGFIQDLIRGIKKVIVKDNPKERKYSEEEFNNAVMEALRANMATQANIAAQSEKAVQANADMQQNSMVHNLEALIDRGNIALEDGDWQKADDFFEEALNQNAKCAEAYLGKLLIYYKKSNISELTDYYKDKCKITQPEQKKIEACAEETERIENAVSKYAVKGYVEIKDILALYIYDRYYTSELDSIKKQRDGIITYLSNDKMLSHARQYASGNTKIKLDKMLSEITANIDKRISDDEEADKKAADFIKQGYKVRLDYADRKSAELHDKAEQKIKQAHERDEQLGVLDLRNIIKKLENEVNILQEKIASQKNDIEKKNNERKNLSFFNIKAKDSLYTEIYYLQKVLDSLQAEADEKNKEIENCTNEIEIKKNKSETALKDESESEKNISLLRNQNKGDIVRLGHYEQGDSEARILEWIILDKSDDNIVLISRNAIDLKCFDQNDSINNWTESSLCSWLNDYFWNNVFTLLEKYKIKELFENANGEERVSLLSVEEAEMYFNSDDNRKCYSNRFVTELSMTEYENEGLGIPCDLKYDEEAIKAYEPITCYWWLKSGGCYKKEHLLDYVNDTGKIISYSSGYGALPSDIMTVRPVLKFKFKGEI